MRKAQKWLLVGSVAALVLAACAASNDAGRSNVPSDTTGSAAASPTTTTQPHGAFDFTARTLDGDTIDGASLKGKDVVLWFWAPWCPTCLVEGKDQVSAALDQLPDGVEFVGVAGRSNDLGEMAQFLEWTGTGGVSHIVDSDGSIWAGFRVALQPAFYFVNQDGTFRRAGSGLTTEDILNEAEMLLTH